MTIAKYIRRDHAYVGQTFSSTRRLGRGRQSCILQGGLVSEADPYGDSGPTALTIAPFILELDGLIIHSDVDIVEPYTAPTNPGDTMFLVVSSPDDTDASGVVWTIITRAVDYTSGFVFAVRRNVGSGAIWMHTPVGSLRAILDRIENPLEHKSERPAHVDAERFRPALTTLGPTTAVLVQGPASGLLTSALGASMGFDSGGFVLPDAHHAYTRRDRLVLRRGDFGPNTRYGKASYGGVLPTEDDVAEGPLDRFAYIDVIPGVPRRSDVADIAAAFAQNDNVGAAGSAIDTGRKLGADINKHVTARDGTYTRATGYNHLYIAYQTVANDLQSTRVDPDRSTVPAGTDIAAAAAGPVRTDLNMVILPSGESIILYTYNGGAGQEELYLSKVDADGLAFSLTDQPVYAATGLGGAADGIHRPKGFVDQDGNIQIVMEVELSPGGGGANGDGEALYWMKISDTGSVLSQPVRLTDSSSDVTATPAYENQSALYVDGEILITAIRRADQTVAGDLPDARYLSFSDPATVTEETMNLAASVASVDFRQRVLTVGSFQATSAIATTVAASGPRAAAIFSNADIGFDRRYVNYGVPGVSELGFFNRRDDAGVVSSLGLLHHSDQLGDPAAGVPLSQSSQQLASVHDGTAIHLVGWDAVNSQLVYERAVPHSLNDLPFAGELTTRYNLLDVAGAADTAIPSDLLMVRAASGEVVVVRITAAGVGDAGAVVVTEITGIEGEPDPLTPDVTVLAEFDVQGGADATTAPPAMLESARLTRPARDLVVGAGGPGGLVGSSGLLLALETLRGSGGTIRVRAGFYDVLQPLRLYGGIDVKCDPGVIIRSRSTDGQGALIAVGGAIAVTAMDTLGTASITGMGGFHLSTLGFTTGCILREDATGDEYYITELLEKNNRIRVDDPSMPLGNYSILQTGISWSGGTFVGDFGIGVRLSRVARFSLSGCHFKTGTTGTPPLFVIAGSSDVDIRRIYADLGANGTLFPTNKALLTQPSRRVSIRESQFLNGTEIGVVSEWSSFNLIDMRFQDNTANNLTIEDSSGQVDKIRLDTDQGALATRGSGRVIIGDTDFGFQNDQTRSGPFSDTLNKPTFTDAWFRGNVYISGYLNHGQYDLAILALAMLVLDEELFQLYGMVDGITETFQTFDDVENNAFYAVPSTSVAGRWYPDVAPLVLGTPVGPTSVALVGLSDRAAPDSVLDGFVEVVPMNQLNDTGTGGLRGRHSSVRGVIHHDAHPAGATDGQDGYPDRGKIEFQGSFGGAEGSDLIGEAGSYALLTQNLESTTGTDGEQLEFTSRRFDLSTGLVVGEVGNSPGGHKQWQRVYDAYTGLDDNRIAVVSTEVVTGLPGNGWGLRLRADLFNATTGAFVGGAEISNSGGGHYVFDWMVHLDKDNALSTIEEYGELAEVKIVPDLANPSELWVLGLGRFWDNVEVGAQWRVGIRLAKIDLTAVTFDPTNLFVDVGGAGIKFKELDGTVAPTRLYRGLSVVPVAHAFDGSPPDANNYLFTFMVALVVDANGVGDWTPRMGVLDSAGNLSGSMASPAASTISNRYIPCAMANENEMLSMVGTGVLAGSLNQNFSRPWKPLSGGSFIAAGDLRATFVVAHSPNRTTKVGSILTAIYVPWLAAGAPGAPQAATVLASAAFDLDHMPGAIWDGDGDQFMLGYTVFSGSQAEVFTRLAPYAAGWTWSVPTSRRAMAAPTVKNIVVASLADQDDLTANQLLNVAWQGQNGGDADLWGGVQIDNGDALTLGNWYDTANGEITAAESRVLNMARYWMADAQWDPSAQLAAPATSDTLDREHYLLYHTDGTGNTGDVHLRCVGRQAAVKVEMDVPWGDNLQTLTMRIRGGGETNGVGAAAVEGLAGFPQSGFRDGANSTDLTNADAAPTHDDYDGTSPLFVATADGFSGGLWDSNGVALSGTTDNLAAANVTQREILTATSPHILFAYAAGDRIIPLEGPSGIKLTGLGNVELQSLMVGMTVVLTGAPGPGGATEHRITYFGDDAGGFYRMVIEPPVGFASHAVPANNTYEFRKHVTGAVFVPPDGEATIVHPERVWINQLELDASRAAELVGSTVDTSVNPVIIPPASAIVLMSLIDTDGSLAADLAANPTVDLTDYMTLYLTRNIATEGWIQATMVDLVSGGPNPLQQTAMGDGSTVFVVFAEILWPIGPFAFNDVGYRVVWNGAGGFPGRHLHIDRVVMGWN